MKKIFGNQNKKMNKIIAMIPARMGSKRVPKKNLRLLNGRPLISYNLETVVESKMFDDVYINSEDEVFKKIAENYGAKFYKRPKELASDETNNDEFLIDFMKNIKGNILIQILPTSPLLKVDEIKNFVKLMLEKNYDTLVSTNKHQIASIFENQPINFAIKEPHISSQNMIPVETYATVLMGWKYDNFINNFNSLGFAYHGGNGKIGYFAIDGLTKIDIDTEEDFKLAEVAIAMLNKKDAFEPKYYGNTNVSIETDVPEILRKDGVIFNNFKEENKQISKISKIIEQNGNTKSWCHRLVNTDSNSATLIGQLPGEGNRLHYHPNWNEWWYIFKGTWEWVIENEKKIISEGDFVFIEKGKKHKITAIGGQLAVRLAVSRADVEHIYP